MKLFIAVLKKHSLILQNNARRSGKQASSSNQCTIRHRRTHRTAFPRAGAGLRARVANESRGAVLCIVAGGVRARAAVVLGRAALRTRLAAAAVLRRTAEAAARRYAGDAAAVAELLRGAAALAAVAAAAAPVRAAA